MLACKTYDTVNHVPLSRLQVNFILVCFCSIERVSKFYVILLKYRFETLKRVAFRFLNNELELNMLLFDKQNIALYDSEEEYTKAENSKM